MTAIWAIGCSAFHQRDADGEIPWLWRWLIPIHFSLSLSFFLSTSLSFSLSFAFLFPFSFFSFFSLVYFPSHLLPLPLLIFLSSLSPSSFFSHSFSSTASRLFAPPSILPLSPSPIFLFVCFFIPNSNRISLTYWNGNLKLIPVPLNTVRIFCIYFMTKQNHIFLHTKINKQIKTETPPKPDLRQDPGTDNLEIFQ